MLDVIVLAIALAADATAVAAARGLVSRRPGADALALATVFGGFQAAMAALGWRAGASAARWITAWDHWIAFAILVGLGARMIHAGLRGDDVDRDAPLTARTLLILGVATSIDALAAGVTLPLLDVPEGLAVLLIGAVTFALSLAGALLGRSLGARFGGRLEVLGGLALCGIGVKTLLEHLLTHPAG